MNNRLPFADDRTRGRRGFTLVEMLVVIGVITILISILVPVIGRVQEKAKETQTRALMQNIDDAIRAYSMDNGGAYPGPAPQGTANPTMAENLLLGLAGGRNAAGTYVVGEVGKGPFGGTGVNKKRYPAYFEVQNGSPKISSGTAKFSIAGKSGSDSNVPEFLDAFPQKLPILYLRANRGASGIVGTTTTFQYSLTDVTPYTTAGYLGKNHGLQSATGAKAADRPRTLWYFTNAEIANTPKQKDGYILISAGPDRTYGTYDDITNFGTITPDP